MTRCDAWHDGHDCTRPGACQRALTEMCERIDAREANAERLERERQHRPEVAA